MLTITCTIAPQKSSLKPPKLAPSAWQLYFTDWIQRHQATSQKKLNVAQAAKEAGQEYAKLSPAQKEVRSMQILSVFVLIDDRFHLSLTGAVHKLPRRHGSVNMRPIFVA